jgi:hypothetical protein
MGEKVVRGFVRGCEGFSVNPSLDLKTPHTSMRGE